MMIRRWLLSLSTLSGASRVRSLPRGRAFVALFALAAACGEEPAEDWTLGPNVKAVTFSDSFEPFSGAGYDTGWKPSGSPVQVRFFITAQSSVSGSMKGKARLSGAPGSPTLCYRGDPDGGQFGMDIGFQIAAKLKVNKFPFKAEVKLPYLPNKDYRFADEVTYTPFVLTGSRETPHLEDGGPTKSLWDVPLPGLSIPYVGGGSVGIKLGGNLIMDLRGRSIETIPDGGGSAVVQTEEGQDLPWPSASGTHFKGEATYRGDVLLSGDLVISPAITVSAPAIHWSHTVKEFPIKVGVEKLVNAVQPFETKVAVSFDIPQE